MKSKDVGVKRGLIPEYRIIDVDPFRSVIQVIGDDPDGGCRTLQVDDLLRIRGGNPNRKWEVMALDFRLRQIFIKPYRGRQGLAGINVGTVLEIAEMAWDSPGFGARRRKADRQALGPKKVEDLAEP